MTDILRIIAVLNLLVFALLFVGCSERRAYETVTTEDSTTVLIPEDSEEISTDSSKVTEVSEAEITEASSRVTTVAETTTEPSTEITTTEPIVSEEVKSDVTTGTEETVDEVEEGYSFTVNQIASDRDALTTSPDELDEVSDVIVKAVPIAQENMLVTDASGSVITGYLKTTVQVTEVYKGEIDLNDEIIITEECYFTDSNSVLWTNGYIPMSIGSEYLLFLSAYSQDSSYAGMYFPVDLEYGKYAVSDSGAFLDARSELSVYTLQISDYTDKEKYIEWYNYVASRFQ